MRKYAVVPGEVLSLNDGEVHFIGFGELCRLYGVNPSECIDCSRAMGGTRPESFRLPILRPQYDGNYTLSKVQEK